MTYKNILAYVDTRHLPPDDVLQPCLASLARLAAAHEATLTLCDVLEAPPSSSEAGAPDTRLGALRMRHARDTLTRLAGQIGQLVWADRVVLQGNEFVQITRHCMRHEIDLVACLGTRERTSRNAATASHLVRKAPAAVWVMGGRRQCTRKHIAVAVDRDIFPASDFPQQMANRLVEAAVALSRDQATTIELVHAWSVYGAELIEDAATGLDASEVASYIDAQRYSHTLWLEEVHEYLRQCVARQGRGTIDTRARLLEGPAIEILPQWVSSAEPDVLVIGTLGTSATPGLFIGNTAETILGITDIPLLTLKPPGFRSPVEP
jgi:universal stress protein E